jgi:hypothetical protein
MTCLICCAKSSTWAQNGYLDVYDFTLQKWLVMNSRRPDDVPTPRSGAAVTVFDGKIMLMGSESSEQTNNRRGSLILYGDEHEGLRQVGLFLASFGLLPQSPIL